MGFQIGFPALRNHPPAGITYDADAQDYINRVETADGSALETATKDAMNQLFLDLKSNSLWTSIVYALPLCGPRTIAGAMIPLQNTTASNTAGSLAWSRKVGVSVNASSGSNAVEIPTAFNSTGSQNDFSLSAWITALAANDALYFGMIRNRISRVNTNNVRSTRCQVGTSDNLATNSDATGFTCVSRSGSANYSRRIGGATSTVTRASTTPTGNQYRAFRQHDGTLQASINTGVGWLHIGTALTPATLETVVTAYRNAINTAF